ncbi:MAG: molybdenum cofactor guanylyltransferase [Ignavibacteriae bacterium]|nr:molybdenum cofactor guanylyltransferase [Ignavibacteriota bacterium]
MNENFTAIILSGGKSKRIGSDKALLKINGITLIERIQILLKEIFNEVIIISNSPENYNFINSKIYRDIFPGFGPLSGIHSGLINSTSENIFFISCDMPFVTKDLINFLILQTKSEDILIPKSHNNFQTLCAVYKKSCIPKAEELLKLASEKINENGKTKVKLYDLINSLNTKFVEISDESFFNDRLIFNMNSLDDFEFVKNILE